VTALRRWCRITIVRDDMVLGRSVVEGDGLPSIDAVDALARLLLLARRLDARIVCGDIVPELLELLTLAGLDVEVQWQTEGWEEPVEIERREEEVHPGDLGT
jgi:hypothetical protein